MESGFSWKTLEDAFFNKKFWLAENVTWDDFRNTQSSEVYIPQPKDLVWIFPTAFVILLVRTIVERFIAYPFGCYMRISTKKVVASNNPNLEKVYLRTHHPKDSEVAALCKQLDLQERYIQRWFRRRRNQDRPSPMTKFTETGWRCFFYVVMFCFGLYVLWDKTWFWDIKNCWRGHPKQHVPADIWWYYNIELGFYVCLIFSQFADVKRSDFWEMFLHHITTIMLMSFSWITNYVRVGTLILCLHDSVDYLLEGAKLARYLNMRTLCDVLFGVFTLMWAVTRLGLYPYYILHTVLYDSYALAGSCIALHVFNVLLWVLQGLHIFWFVLISGVAYKAIVEGKVDKDIRSASEESGNE